jgi:two-component system C4-dicarboxylate transport sensor histidine kinase DctB
MQAQGVIDVTLAADEHDVVLSIRDYGPGIDAEQRPRIFDPFFTTKKGGQGIGLGLSITYQLITRNSGTIQVVTPKGGGVEFIIRFPLFPRLNAAFSPPGAVVQGDVEV